MRLARAPLVYAKAAIDSILATIEAAFKRFFVRGEDVEVGSARLILKDRTTGDLYIVFIDGGVLDIELKP